MLASYNGMLMQVSEKTMFYKSAITSDIYSFAVYYIGYIWWYILSTCYEYSVVACIVFYNM